MEAGSATTVHLQSLSANIFPPAVTTVYRQRNEPAKGWSRRGQRLNMTFDTCLWSCSVFATDSYMLRVVIFVMWRTVSGSDMAEQLPLVDKLQPGSCCSFCAPFCAPPVCPSVLVHQFLLPRGSGAPPHFVPTTRLDFHVLGGTSSAHPSEPQTFSGGPKKQS